VFSPAILIVTVDQWNIDSVAELLYTVGSIILIIHAASTGFTGWASGPIKNKAVRAVLVLLALASITLHPLPVLLTLLTLTAVSIAVRRGMNI